jgi:Ca2+/Na+ antiporter
MMDGVNSRRGGAERQLAQRALMSSVGVFVLTSIHHGYGAYLYRTPWRLHAAIVSGGATMLMAGLLMLFRSRHMGTVARWCFVILGLLVPFVAFGIFEGGYNHTVKDVLYFSNASPQLIRRLFPPGLYELPNDMFFEVTGVLQIIPGVLTGYYLFELARNIRNAHSNSAEKSLSVLSPRS